MNRSDVFLRKQALPKYRQQSMVTVSTDPWRYERVICKASVTHVTCIGRYPLNRRLRNEAARQVVKQAEEGGGKS